MSTFPCAGAKSTFLETANRSNCVFLASTFTEPYMEQCKTEHKHTNAFSFKDMSSTQVSTFISQSYFILDFTQSSLVLCMQTTHDGTRNTSCRICSLLTAGIHDLRSTTSFCSTVFPKAQRCPLTEHSHVRAATETEKSPVSNHYGYSPGEHQNTEQAKPSTGMSSGVYSDPQRKQEFSKAGN